jgi:CRP-like cAMP-binding protein
MFDEKEVDLLYYWVMKNVSTNKIFQGVQEIICKTICREMTLLQIPAKGIVCYQGDYGDIFFIIISGSVSLYVDTRKKAREHDLPRYYDPRRFSIMGRLDEEDGAPADNYGSFIKQILAGGTFGELAVMDPTARRSCTVICDEDTSFICLKRGAYQRLIRNTNSTNLDFTQVEFLETLFLFAGWQHGEIIKISNRLRQMNFTADVCIH